MIKHLMTPDKIRKFFPILPQYNYYGKRLYKAGDNLYPSVTTVSTHARDDTFKKWREENPEKAKFAPDRGTIFHMFVEMYLDNNPLDKIESYAQELEKKHEGQYYQNPATIALKNLKTVMPLLDKIDSVFVQEVCLYSDLLKVAGRVDCVAKYNGKISIVDFKSGFKRKKDFWIKDYYIQTAAYSVMWKEMTGLDVEQLVLIVASDEDEITEPMGVGEVFIQSPENWYSELEKTIISFYQKYEYFKNVTINNPKLVESDYTVNDIL